MVRGGRLEASADVRACSRNIKLCKEWQKVRRGFRCPKEGLEAAASCKTFVFLCFSQALRLLSSCPAWALRPDVVCYGAAALHQRWFWAGELLRELRSRGLEVSEVFYHLLLARSAWRLALDLLSAPRWGA